MLKGNPARKPPTVRRRARVTVRLEPEGLNSAPRWPECKASVGVSLTIGHESHNGMGGATQVGRGTLIGYNSKQGDGTIRGETKHSSQHQDPELEGQCRVAVRV